MLCFLYYGFCKFVGCYSDDESEEAEPPQKRQRLEDSFFGDMLQPAAANAASEADLYRISAETGDNLLEFWKGKASQWPRLAKVAKMIMAIPATETSSERVFSIAWRTLEERRSRLHADTVDDLMLVHGLHR